MVQANRFGGLGWGCALAVGVVASFVPVRAQACSGDVCSKSALFPMSGNVPENAVGWVAKNSVNWVSDGDAGSGGVTYRIALEMGDADGGERQLVLDEAAASDSYVARVAPDVAISPSEALSEGDKLRVEHTEACYGEEQTGIIEITASAPIPTLLGTLQTQVKHGELLVWTDSASCVEPLGTAYVTVTVDMDTGALPFADVLRYVLLVDGAPYHQEEKTYVFEDDDDRRLGATLGGSVFGVGLERVFAVCSVRPESGSSIESLRKYHGIGEGAHMLQMAGLLPDGSAVLSDTVTVELECPPCDADGGACVPTEAGVDSGSEAGTGETPDATVSNPTQSVDATFEPPPEKDSGTPGPIAADASVSSNTDAASNEGPTTQEATRRSSGCSFASPASTSGNSPRCVGTGALIALAALAFSRRSGRASPV